MQLRSLGVEMKKLIVSLFVVGFGCLFVSAESQVEKEPKAQKKYQFQCLYLSVPNALFQSMISSTNKVDLGSEKAKKKVSSDGTIISTSGYSNLNVNALIKNPAVKIVPFPALFVRLAYFEIGDGLNAVSVRNDFKVENGKIVYLNKTIMLGKRVVVALFLVEDDSVTYQFECMISKQCGFDKVNAGNNLVATLPVFTKLSIKTRITQKKGTWATIIGNQITPKGKGKESTMQQLICIRVL